MNEIADIPSLNAFLNAALREGALADAHFTADRLRFHTTEGSAVSVSVERRSRFRCRFSGPITIDGAPTTIEDLLQRLVRNADPAFANRVGDSLLTIRHTLDATGDPESWNFQDCETALRFGHVLHPNPRSRDGLSSEEAMVYAPESTATFALSWFACRPSALQNGGIAAEGFQSLAAADGIETLAGRFPFPFHPLQLARLCGTEAFSELIRSEAILPLGPGKAGWNATASMRAVHAFHAPFMAKFSLSVRLTNSLRLLSEREVLRGLHVTDLLNSDIGVEIADAFPNLTVLTEPAYAALKTTDGTMMPETLVVLRDNPYRDGTQYGPIVLAALCETPRRGLSPVGRIVRRLAKGGDTTGLAMRWFDLFLETAILPILEMRARWGLLFGSHQQNMMLKIRDGWPSGVAIRDCQGTGHLAAFHDRLAAVCPGIGEGAENIVGEEEGDGLLTYYVVVNSVMNMLATLVIDGLAGEEALFAIWKRFLERAARQTPGDATLYLRLMNRPGLMTKANFATSLSGVNEADGGAEGQLAQFTELDNPIAQSEAA
ncbi:IucA/IucC family siderophore biosynthesis protein [Notoacmeibacter sp. MSK16QG-6]|uniref:IucA/IucC family protein n=1 Tax=Notoacmeibacter sp. MSK16QG-6 TaxID=2957982 RepID=UPI00209CF061|nr:IucA/IucC family protein [Notoacmeibacter sp. MSK16QG-6]MCP1198310.1 hypothetical protein [Notoacmeibacter sp. MSK16QG-6]